MFKTQLLSESPVILAGAGLSVSPTVDVMTGQLPQLAEKLFSLDRNERVDYEQGNDTFIASKARRNGVSVWEKHTTLC